VLFELDFLTSLAFLGLGIAQYTMT